MAKPLRKFTEKPPEILEQIMEDCLDIIGVKLDEAKIKLLIRLIISGISNHYFFFPDDLIKLGFVEFYKNPDKDELFRVSILRDTESGVVNAETLWKYYKGDIKKEKEIKETLGNFLEDLISYSKEQEKEITQLTSQIEKRRRN